MLIEYIQVYRRNNGVPHGVLLIEESGVGSRLNVVPVLSILTLAAVTLIRPSAQAYRDIQLQTRAQNLADALIETIRGEVLDANGYIRFTNGATDSANLDSVFDAQTSYSDGTALEFSVYPNHVELIDKDLVPALKNSKGKDLNALVTRVSRILKICSCSSKIVIFQKFGVKIGVR